MTNDSLTATLTCPDPLCRHQQTVTMPTTYCQLVYTCEACLRTHRHRRGDCCVFCSYADTQCPSKRAQALNEHGREETV